MKRVFQLDECTNSRELADKCNSDGLVEVRRFPARLRGADDAVLIRSLFCAEAWNPLVTTDREIVDDHVESFPPVHPGILIIANAVHGRPSLTTKVIVRILEGAKRLFGDWPRLSLQNSIIELSEAWIRVGHLGESRTTWDIYADLSQPGQLDKIREVLQDNMKRV